MSRQERDVNEDVETLAEALAKVIRPWTLCDDGGGFDHGSERAARAVLAAGYRRVIPPGSTAQPSPASPDTEGGAPVQCPTCGEYPYGCSWMPGGCCSDCPHGTRAPSPDTAADRSPTGQKETE